MGKIHGSYLHRSKIPTEIDSTKQKEIYNTELSLICDQRYSKEEIDFQNEIVKKCLNKSEGKATNNG